MAGALSKNYTDILQGLKEKIRQARLRTILAVIFTGGILHGETSFTILQQAVAKSAYKINNCGAAEMFVLLLVLK